MLQGTSLRNSHVAKAKAPLKSGKTRAKSGSLRRRASAGEETASVRPGLSFPIVAIGASAGGLAAFTELLKALPPKTGMAFVLIQHMEPKHESALTALLSRATSMTVLEVSDGMAVEPNCVYVIPPNKDMTIRKGILRLAPRSAGSGLQRPIDDFSIALAQELRQREHEIRAVLDNSPDVIIRMDREQRYAYVNATTSKVGGMPPEAFMGKTPREAGMPENLCDLWTRTFRAVFDSGLEQVVEIAFPSPPAASETIWEERMLPEFAADGTIESVLVIGRDITKRRELEKVAQRRAQEVQALASSLLTAQEEERRRVSRDLHDQVCQQLASLAMDIGGMVVNLPPRGGVQKRLKELQVLAVRVSEEVRHIAYELHPSMLDDLGLAASVRALCNEFSGRNRSATLAFTGGAMPASVPGEVASCLFRVAQEALQNIAKHSRARHVSVDLAFENGVVALAIADDGTGFDLEAVKGRGGLGLIGVEERVRLVNGKITITAEPRHGTRIAVRVPLSSDRL